jgi:RHS repeat-associated protein
VFDIRDDLREVKIGGSTVGKFLYDYQGLRIEKLGERGAERNTYDDQSILQQYDNANLTRAKFDYGASSLLSLNAQDEPTQFYLYDVLNSVANPTNSDGAVQARYQYDAWGIKRNQVGTSYNRFSFTGYEEDKETGLLYAKARYYDPDGARFLSEDAYEGDFLMAPSLHRYLYAFQNPTVYNDPTGNIVCGGLCIAGAIVAGATVVDYFTSDRRQRVRNQIQPESFGGELLSDSIALSQSASNTLSFGYFDANQRAGTQGMVEHTKENILPINASKNAYNEFTSPAGDKMKGTLHALKGLGQTASLGLGAAGLRNPSASAGRGVADDIGPGVQKTKLVEEADDVITPATFDYQTLKDGGARYIYDPRVNKPGASKELYRDTKTGQLVSAQDIPWPNPHYVKGTKSRGDLEVGTELDRMGSDRGRFGAIGEGTASERGLPGGSEFRPTRKYKVTSKGVSGETSVAAPVRDFGAKGGAKQFEADKSFRALVDEELIKELK